jgi:peptidoglycan/xylan/chitin deacetylase (PgdA/CDA1 family)
MLSFLSNGVMARPLMRAAVILFALTAACYSQTVPASYQLGAWQGFRSAAISYTFDDNCPNQLAIAVPMFDRFGFKVTLFTVTSPDWAWKANWGGLQKAASEGHEIASHTIDHPNFSQISDSAQQAELVLSQDTINAHIKGATCITMAYPYCATGNSAMVADYYVAARGCSGQIVGKTPYDFMNISSFVCGDQGLNTAAAIESEANSAAASNGWCVYLMHGINGTEPGACSPISPDTILATLDYLSANPDKFWVAPFGTVARYIKERNSASVSEVSAGSDSITVRLTDNLDSAYYNVPLTLRRQLPAGWDSASVYQNGDTVPSSIVKIDSIRYVMFDAVPDTGNITIAKETVTSVGLRDGVSTPTTFGLLQNYPNPFNPATAISYELSAFSSVTLKVYDVLGREVETLVDDRENAGNHFVTFNGDKLASGVYFYRLEAGATTLQKKMVLIK